LLTIINKIFNREDAEVLFFPSIIKSNSEEAEDAENGEEVFGFEAYSKNQSKRAIAMFQIEKNINAEKAEDTEDAEG